MPPTSRPPRPPPRHSARGALAVVSLAALAIAVVTAVVTVTTGSRPATADDIHFIEYTTTTPGPLGSVTFIGDSVGIGAGRFAPRLSDHLEALGWGPIRFHGVDGKRTGYPPGWPDHFNAVPLIDQWQASGWDSDTWIINLGANDSGFCGRDVACARASIMLVVDAIGPGHRIWWPKITRLYTYQHQADAWNTALDQVAAERPDFSTWDWPAEMRAHPDVYGSWDGTHLYPDGYRRRSLVMARAFTDAVARATRTGPDAPLPASVGPRSELLLDVPIRVLDTRVDPPGRLAAGSTVTVDLSGHVPTTATAVAIGLTAVRPVAEGYLAAFPCDGSGGPSETSSLNHGVRTRAAPSVVPLADDHTICVSTRSATDLIVDLQAVFVGEGTDAAALRLDPLPGPRRLLDTRRTGRAAVLRVEVPGGPAAAAVNLTIARPDEPGHLSTGPCAAGATGEDDPSNLNFAPGDALAASAFVALDGAGTFCITTSVPVDVIVDLAGTLGTDGSLAFVPAAPARLLDTRTGLGGWSPIHGNADVIDIRAAPPAARAMTGTVTIVRPRTRGFLTTTPCGGPTASSSVNAATGDVVANGVTVGLDDAQRLCITAAHVGHTLVDVTGWWLP